MRTAILGSKHSNFMTFKIDWTKNRTAITEGQDSEDDQICGLPELSKVFVYEENILAHIGGFISRKLTKLCSVHE